MKLQVIFSVVLTILATPTYAEQLNMEIKNEAIQDEFQVTRQKFLDLLNQPKPQLRDARQAIKFFKDKEDWRSLAIAYEVTTEIMWDVIHKEPNAFIRQSNKEPNENMMERGPYVLVQTNLDGEWVNGKGSAENWIDWIQRKQKNIAEERIALLKQLGILYLERLDDPERAVTVYKAAGRDVPIFTESLDVLIPQIYPELKSDAKDILGLDQDTRPDLLRHLIPQTAQIHLESLRGFAQAQTAAGKLRQAADTHLRAMLCALIIDRGDWNAHGSANEAEAFWKVACRLPVDQPLPPTLWLHILGPETSEITIPAPEEGPHGLPYSHPGPRFVLQPGYTAKTLTIDADMETSGGCGHVRCFTIRDGKVHEIGNVRWFMDNREGGEWRTETFELPKDVGIIRLEITPFNGSAFHVRNLKVKAAFIDNEEKTN